MTLRDRQLPNAEPLPELVTVREVAAILKISTRSIWRLIEQKKIFPPIHVGGSVRWRKEQIRHWIEAGCPEYHPD